jgi:Secretion system C-terminal sorting domain
MKKFSITLFAVCILLGAFAQVQESGIASLPVLNADQVSKLDISGKWSGKRNQYTWDHKSFVESFEYEFNLVQQGNIVTGTSTIMDANGNYADMQLEGVLIGNKLHFREYSVKNAIRPEGKVWCFKSGELSFARDGDNLRLVGSTPSFMEVYNYPCSGGETNIVKVDNSSNATIMAAPTTASPLSLGPDIKITAYPNPFVESANIGYTIPEASTVTVEVFDISGKMVTTLYNGNQNAGSYVYNFSGKNFASNSGIYVVKMTVNGNVYSQQMVQIR